MYGDRACRDQGDVIRKRAPKAKDFINQRYSYNGQIDQVEWLKNRSKLKIRSRAEHAFWIIKGLDSRRFGIEAWRKTSTVCR